MGLVDYAAESFSSFRQLSTSSETFVDLIKIANRKIKVKTAVTLSNHVSKKAKSVKQDICNVIITVKPDLVSASFTTDMWTSRSGDSFMSLTVHFIDRYIIITIMINHPDDYDHEYNDHHD